MDTDLEIRCICGRVFESIAGRQRHRLTCGVERTRSEEAMMALVAKRKRLDEEAEYADQEHTPVAGPVSARCTISALRSCLSTVL
jgi:hypothetical protein